jgi:putative membrane protein
MAWLPVGAYGALAAVDTWLGYPQIADIHLISPFAMGIPFFFASVQILINRSDLPFWPFGSAARAELERANG